MLLHHRVSLKFVLEMQTPVDNADSESDGELPARLPSPLHSVGEESHVDKPADSDALALGALKDGDDDDDEEAVSVPLPDEDNIDLYLCPMIHWWEIGHHVTHEVIELSASDNRWAVAYDEAGFATAVRDDDGPDTKQAYQVIEFMEAWFLLLHKV